MTPDSIHDQTDAGVQKVEGLSGTASSVASDLKAAVIDTFNAAVGEVRSQADDAKASVADEVNDVAMALRKASQDLRNGSAQERTLGQIANGLADASDALRDKDLGEIIGAISKIARQNPMLFLGGAVMLGFAASRFAKASTSHAGASPRGSYSAYGMSRQAPSTGPGAMP